MRCRVARLKRAGAILIGKTTTPEFGHMPYTEAPLFGRTRNAWAADRTSGGSSGGAAVALAAGVCPIGVGTDAGGSTRIPAACNGVVGFKQSAGVVPHDMAPEVFANVSSINPMARTVMDTALMLEAMAGQHPCDPYSYGAPASGFVAAARPEGSLEGMRIAWRPLLGQHRDRQPGARGRARRRPWRWASSAPPSSRWTTTWSRSSPSGSPIPAPCGTRASAMLLPQWGNKLSPTLLRQMELGKDTTGEAVGRALLARTAALPQGAGLVRALRRHRHADADAHGDPHRGAPVRADRDRGAARPIPCARPGIPTRIPSI